MDTAVDVAGIRKLDFPNPRGLTQRYLHKYTRWKQGVGGAWVLDRRAQGSARRSHGCGFV